MKTTLRLFFTLIALATGMTLQAQLYYFGSPMTPEERTKIKETREEGWKKMKETRVEAITEVAEVYKKGKVKHSPSISNKHYLNPNGQTTEWENYLWNGKLAIVMQSEYDAFGNQKAQITKTPKGKLMSRREYDYEGDVLKISRTYRGKKARYASRTEYNYDAASRLLESKSFKPKKEKLTFRTACTYHEDGSKKRVEKFNRKGKLVSATDYSCDAVGKTLSASKANERIVCERFEHDANGQTVKVVESFMGEKDNYRSISKYDARNYVIEQTNYDEAGDIVRQWVNTYNDKGHLLTSERRARGGKLELRSEYQRDSNGLTLSHVSHNGKGEIVMKFQYSYSFY